jgi:2-dehydropantoate 2-reductase
MQIILIGTGRIGSTLAFHLAGNGHEVTVVARGARFEALIRERAIVTTDGARARVTVAASLDPGTPCDLVIVTIPEPNIMPLLATLSASRARAVLFMFNTFAGTERYRSAVGDHRFAFGFPNMTAYLEKDKVRFRVRGPGMVTTLSRPDLAELFEQSGLPSEVETDMDAFLKSHVAMTVPLFLSGLRTWQRAANLTWAEARQLDLAWLEAFDLVRRQGYALKPPLVDKLSRLPSAVRTALLWMFSRSKLVKDMGEFGPAETRHLIDAMEAMAPGRLPNLLALRP